MIHSTFWRPSRRTAVCAVLGALLAWSSPLQTAAQDFAGETIEIIVPAGEGGGTDFWARFYVPVLQEYLPGSPRVVVRNMRGGGHTIGGNFFAENAQPDGKMLLASSGTGHFNYLLGDSRVRYDFNDMRSVVGSPVGGVMYVAGDLGVSGPDDIAALRGADLRYGSQGPTSQDLLSFYALEQLGVMPRPIFGMGGRSDARLGFERGDLNIDYQSTFAYEENVRPMVEAGQAVPIFTFGVLDENGDLARDPAFPDLPHFGEVFEEVNGAPLSGQAKEVYMSFFTAGFGAQKLLSMPADTPAEIIAMYDDALTAAKNDPGFVAKREEALGPYPQFMGESAERMKTIATSVSPEAKAAVAGWLKERFDAEVN
jgi:tripartite-type tricarboxylate transporter receptor subunit TctC